jgi:tetratricopeptide (TPR) repeat protein
MESTEAKLFYLRGLALYEMKDYKKAIKDLKRALKLKPTASFSHDWYEYLQYTHSPAITTLEFHIVIYNDMKVQCQRSQKP